MSSQGRQNWRQRQGPGVWTRHRRDQTFLIDFQGTGLSSAGESAEEYTERRAVSGRAIEKFTKSEQSHEIEST